LIKNFNESSSGIYDPIKKEELLMNLVFSKVDQTFPKEKRNTLVLDQLFDDLNARYKNRAHQEVDFTKDGKVSLDIFINNGTGACRHLSLVAAALLEKLIDEKIIEGKVSVDKARFDIDGVNKGHVWARYTMNNGTVYIIDPMLLKKPLILNDAIEFNGGIGNYYAREKDKNRHDKPT